MAAPTQTADSGPVRESGRITSLDLIRGIAVLGILLMNAVNFGLGSAPYFNLSAGGSETSFDWAIGILGEVFVDQKFMGLFSLLFGAGMILFIDRASGKGRRAVLLNLWRNALLLVIGIHHMVLWDGDILDCLRTVVGFPSRAAEAAKPCAHLPWRCRVPAVDCLCAARAEYRRHDRCIAIRFLDTGRDPGR